MDFPPSQGFTITAHGLCTPCPIPTTPATSQLLRGAVRQDQEVLHGLRSHTEQHTLEGLPWQMKVLLCEMCLEHSGSGRAGASGPHAPQDPEWAATSLSRMGSACTRISKAGAPSLSWRGPRAQAARKSNTALPVQSTPSLGPPRSASHSGQVLGSNPRPAPAPPPQTAPSLCTTDYGEPARAKAAGWWAPLGAVGTARA